MGRRYDVDVQVDAHSPVASPTAFVWQDRLYVVREVIDHWHQRGAWWEAPEGTRLDGVTGGEEVWRVAASAGRAHGTGTYLLGHSRQAASAGRRPGRGGWRLMAVVD